MHERKASHVNNSHRLVTATSNANVTTKQPRQNRRGTQQRTGRASLTNQQHATDEQKETQKRIAARAATAMAQIRRRQPRTYLCWGDNRKATIKRYPDGTQEILVPQTLTPEQEHYEFPPRSRLLKKLANSTAERQRLTSLQYNIAPPHVSPKSSHHSNSILLTQSTKLSMLEPDQNALTEWFTGRRRQYRQQQQERQEQQEQDRYHQKQPNAKEKAVMDWMTDIERSTPLLKNPNVPSVTTLNPTPSNLDLQDIGILFKSNAGKLLVTGSSCQKLFGDLYPPSEDTTKHYVRRQRLINDGKKSKLTPSTFSQVRGSSYANTHQQHRQSDHRALPTPITSTTMPPFSANQQLSQVPRPTMSASPTSKSGMVQLVQMFHKTLQEQQARAHERMQQLETLLDEERCKREDIQRTQQMTMSRLDNFVKKYQEHRTPPSPTLSVASSPSLTPSLTLLSSSRQRRLNRDDPSADWTEWMGRIDRLETRVESESRSRECLQRSVNDTVKRVDALKQSLSAQAHVHDVDRQHLEKKINQAFSNLARLTRHRNL